jgi:menaquinol-cytochrome c reductase cytochrome b/c subunit
MELTVSEQTPTTDEIFPKGTTKSYALVEWMRGKSPMVGKGPDDTLFSFPVVLLWEINLLLGVTLAIFLFSLIKQAPLEQIANPMVTTDPAKAPWYFVGLQELLEHMHPTLAGIFIPGTLVVFLLALPYIDRSRQDIGVWFSTGRGKRLVGWTVLYTLITMPTYILLDNAFPLREVLRDLAPSWVAQWFLPAIILIVIVSIPAIIAGRRKASVREILLVLFTVMLVSAAVLTVTGFLFRGPGFKLYWPWQMPNGYNPWTEF